jgi:signal transduction histidine kinase/ActR/RegA family two-component response regulator
MSLAAIDTPAATTGASAGSESDIGILVIESESLTPLGPKIVFANQAAGELTGYDLRSLIGSPLGLVYEHGDLGQLIRKLPVIARQSDYCWMDRVLLRNGGERKLMRWTIRSTRRESDDVRHFTLTFSDPPGQDDSLADPEPETELREPGAKKRDTAREDKTRTESLAITAGGVAHDFKNALQAIKSNLEMADVVTGSSSGAGAKVRQLLADAGLALEDAEGLARQMLAFTRGSPSQRCVFDLSDSLTRVCRLSTAGSRIRHRLRISPDLRPIEGDPSQIYQVLHNLVINASQAMPNGGIINLAASNLEFDSNHNAYSVSAGSYSVISIRDRGYGIAPEHLPKIFEPDFSTKKDGCGFGLASCRSIIENHGGDIRVASRLDVGTEFLIFLPSSEAAVKQAETRETRSSASSARTLRPASGSARVLVVEDDTLVSKATRGMLQILGHSSLLAENGEKALEIFRSHFDSTEPIDLVLLDMTLPGGLDGHEVFKELRRLDSDVNVIATSGYFGEVPSREIIDRGYSGMLAKPYSMDSLALTITESLFS